MNAVRNFTQFPLSPAPLLRFDCGLSNKSCGNNMAARATNEALSQSGISEDEWRGCPESSSQLLAKDHPPANNVGTVWHCSYVLQCQKLLSAYVACSVAPSNSSAFFGRLRG